MSWFGFTVGTLASYRLTRLVVEDEILSDVRQWVWDSHPPEETKIGYFITCPFCVSVWAAGLVALTGRAQYGPLATIRNALAMSGAVSLIQESLDR